MENNLMKGFSALIVDDDDGRRGKVFDLLTDVGVIDGLIAQADCITDARRLLMEKQYDVLIIDIALPNFHRGDVRNYGGADLIDEIFRSDRLFHPTHVIALTAHHEILREHRDRFSAEMVHLLFTNDQEGGWSKSIQALARRALAAKSAFPGSCIDVVIIAAIPATEGRAFLNMELGWSDPVELDVSTTYRIGLVMGHSGPISIALVSPLGVGLIQASIITTKVVERLRPKLVVMSGICAGISGISKLGDLVLASASWEWQAGKYQEGEEEHLAEPNQIPIDDAFLRIFRQMQEREDELIGPIYASWKGAFPPERPALLAGPFASGSSVLARRNLLDGIKRQQRKVLAVDMEVHAVYASCFHASLPRPKFFAVKSVSDLADAGKNDNYHDFCSALSAACVLQVVTRYFDQ